MAMAEGQRQKQEHTRFFFFKFMHVSYLLACQWSKYYLSIKMSGYRLFFLKRNDEETWQRFHTENSKELGLLMELIYQTNLWKSWILVASPDTFLILNSPFQNSQILSLFLLKCLSNLSSALHFITNTVVQALNEDSAIRSQLGPLCSSTQ